MCDGSGRRAGRIETRGAGSVRQCRGGGGRGGPRDARASAVTNGYERVGSCERLRVHQRLWAAASGWKRGADSEEPTARTAEGRVRCGRAAGRGEGRRLQVRER